MAGSVTPPARAALGQQGFHLVQETIRGGATGYWQGLSSRPRALSPGGGWIRPSGVPAWKGAGRRVSAKVGHEKTIERSGPSWE